MKDADLKELRALIHGKKQRADKLRAKAGVATERERTFAAEELRAVELVELLLSSHRTINLNQPAPAATDLEEVVLGALILEPRAIYQVRGILKAEHFYLTAHQIIFRAIEALSMTDLVIDRHVLLDRLQRAGQLQAAGGGYYLVLLLSKVVNTINLEYHARIIIEYWMKRETIRLASEAIYAAYDGTCDVFDLLDRTRGALDTIEPTLDVFKLLQERNKKTVTTR